MNPAANTQLVFRVEYAGEYLLLLPALALYLAAFFALRSVLRHAWRELGGTRRDLVILALLAGVSLLLRLCLAQPYPLNYVELERLPFHEAPGFFLATLLAMPFSLGSRDPLFVQSALNLALSTLAPPFLAVVGAVLVKRRVGLLAGALLATAPIAIRYAITSDVGVSLSLLLPLALVATEVFIRRPSPGSAWPAAAIWVWLMHARPENPTLMLGLLLWFLLDGRFRRSLGLRERGYVNTGLFVLPILVGLGVAAAHVFRGESALRFDIHPERYKWMLFFANERLFLDPSWHHPLLTVLSLVGLLLWARAPVGRALPFVAVLLGFVLPALTVPLAGYGPHISVNLRYVLQGQPLLLLLAAYGLDKLWGRSPGVAGSVGWRPAQGLVLVAASLLAPVVAWSGLRTLAPLQWEHVALEQAVPLVPEDAVLIVAGGDDRNYNPRAQIEYRFLAAGRRLLDPSHEDTASCRGLWITTLAALEGAPLAAACPVYYWKGWAEYINEPPERYTAWRERLDQGWTKAPLLNLDGATIPFRESPEGRIFLGLWQLQRR